MFDEGAEDRCRVRACRQHGRRTEVNHMSSQSDYDAIVIGFGMDGFAFASIMETG